jgi:hypothetical protein
MGLNVIWHAVSPLTLSLQGNNFTGAFSTAIFSLQSLQVSGNYLSNPIQIQGAARPSHSLLFTIGVRCLSMITTSSDVLNQSIIWKLNRVKILRHDHL